jgi:ribosomal protein S27AE
MRREMRPWRETAPVPNELAGPWISCPRCGTAIGLARFAESDDEVGAAVGVCPSCGERVDLASAGAE